MEDAPKINLPALKRAIIEATGDGKPWTRNKLSLEVSGGRSRDTIRDIMRSKSKEPELATVAGIAAALDRPLDDFIQGRRVGRESATMEVIVGAAVQAGIWRESYDWPADERYTVKFDEEDVEGEIFGLRTEGRSMDRVFPPGTDLQCVRLIGSNVTIQDGDYVIVERARGGLRELTCKRLNLRDDGDFELCGESYLSEFNEPIFFGRPDENFFGDDEIRIDALVLNAKKSLYRNRRKTALNSA